MGKDIKISKFTLVRFMYKDESGIDYWLCKKKKEKKLGSWNITHGMSSTPEYKTWCDMKTRCLKEKNKDYKNYGGRGIKVCDKWKNSFENFYKDMGDRPDCKSLDRIDVNGNYCKKNCRWANWEQQQNNKR